MSALGQDLESLLAFLELKGEVFLDAALKYLEAEALENVSASKTAKKDSKKDSNQGKKEKSKKADAKASQKDDSSLAVVSKASCGSDS